MWGFSLRKLSKWKKNHTQRDLSPPNALPRKGDNVRKENFVESFDLKRSSFWRNPSQVIVISPTHPNRMQHIEKKKRRHNPTSNHALIWWN
jgi:DNA polymerase elongation subunit (family B)